MQEPGIRLTWYGTASVRITAGSTQLLIDPFFPLEGSKIRIPANAYSGCSKILITHGHFDHIGSIREIVRPGTAVYCTRAPYRSLRRKGVREEHLHRIKPGDVLTFGDIRITVYRGSHIKLRPWYCLKAVFGRRARQNRKDIIRKLLKFASCREKKEALCYLAEAYGKRILILGSMALAPDTEYPAGADLALFPYQGSDQLFAIAKSIYQTIRPKAVLLTHFDDTFPPFSREVETAGFEHYLKSRAAVYRLRHGGTIEI